MVAFIQRVETSKQLALTLAYSYSYTLRYAILLKMTRLRGGSVDDPDIARSPGHGQTHSYRSKLPPNAPDALIQNTIEVSDPSRVLPRYRDDRRRKFNGLVRR